MYVEDNSCYFPVFREGIKYFSVKLKQIMKDGLIFSETTLCIHYRVWLGFLVRYHHSLLFMVSQEFCSYYMLTILVLGMCRFYGLKQQCCFAKLREKCQWSIFCYKYWEVNIRQNQVTSLWKWWIYYLDHASCCYSTCNRWNNWMIYIIRRVKIFF